MSKHYETDSKLEKLAPVLDDHAEWFGQALRRIFYADQYRNDLPLERPDTLNRWLEEEGHGDYFEMHLIQNLNRVHKELHESADRLMLEGIKGTKPDIRSFEGLLFLYEGFLVQLRRLEHDVAQTDNGIDPSSSLRSRKVMVLELNRELERLSRRGRSFCLCLARIDNFDAIMSNADEAMQKHILQTLGRLIRKCVRSFDDAYRSGDFEFVMCLKHADMSGGSAAINRLRDYLAQEKISVKDSKGHDIPLTMSYCVAEPLPGDTLDELMENMRKDLEQYNKNEGSNTALEYQEQSALTRLVKQLQQ